MSKDSRKSTEWFDAQLRKAKDDFTELARGRPDLRSRELEKGPIERESKPFEPPVKTDTTQARETIPTTPSRAEEARHQPSTTARESQGTRESKRSITAERSQASRSRVTGQSGYRLGADVGGTFTDILLIEEASGRSFTAKVPSTPQDSSIGVLNGIERVCDQAGVSLADISHVMHGTTVATNTVLTASGARVGLVTTKGYKQVLQIARSYVPGGLGGWVIFNKSEPLAPLELTIEADERIGAKGEIVQPLDEEALKQSLMALSQRGIEALTVSLMNAYANGAHEERVRQIADGIFPGIPISISSEVVPEMYEYERTETTVVNSYIRPVVSTYIENLEAELNRPSLIFL